MKELVGTFIVFTAINFWNWLAYGFDLTTKDKIICSLGLEVFILSISIGAYLLGS